MNILGSRLSFKLPKVKVFKKKTEEWKREPEWSWQAVDSPTQDNNNKTPRPHHPHHSQDPGHKTETRHRFLSRDQVDTIHQWLEQLPRPEEVATLLAEEELDTSDVRHLGDSSMVSEAHYRPHHRQHKQSIQTEIF